MDSDDSDDDSDSEIKITGIYHGNRVSHDLFIKHGQEANIESGIFKTSKSKYPIFPYVEEKIKCDEYGEVIRYANNNIKKTTNQQTIKELKQARL